MDDGGFYGAQSTASPVLPPVPSTVALLGIGIVALAPRSPPPLKVTNQFGPRNLLVTGVLFENFKGRPLFFALAQIANRN